MKDWLRRYCISWLVRDLYHAVSADDLLQLHTDENLDTRIRYKGTDLSEEEKRELVRQAHDLEQSLLWKTLKDQVKYEAQTMMFIKSTDFGGMMFGKAALWTIEQMEQAINNLKKH